MSSRGGWYRSGAVGYHSLSKAAHHVFSFPISKANYLLAGELQKLRVIWGGAQIQFQIKFVSMAKCIKYQRKINFLMQWVSP